MTCVIELVAGPSARLSFWQAEEPNCHDLDMVPLESDAQARQNWNQMGGESIPLLDHFHAPLDERFPWESFHSGWATRIADQLSERVPDKFVVAEHTRAGNNLEIDLPASEESRAQARCSR
jgi:hypothetical protein